jgi:hypothetical protein
MIENSLEEQTDVALIFGLSEDMEDNKSSTRGGSTWEIVMESKYG